MSDEWEDAEKLLRDWLRRSREGQHSHHEAGKFCRSVNYFLAVPVMRSPSLSLPATPAPSAAAVAAFPFRDASLPMEARWM